MHINVSCNLINTSLILEEKLKNSNFLSFLLSLIRSVKEAAICK